MQFRIGVASVFFILFSSCSRVDEKNITKWDTTTKIDSDITELEEVRDYVFRKLSENQVSRKEFLKAYSSNNISSTAELLRSSIEEVEEMTEKLSQCLRNNIQEFKENNCIYSGRAEKFDYFVDNYDEILPKLSNMLHVPYKTQQRVSCQYGQYSACLMLAAYGAAATGGAALLVYGGGAYLCLCSYCRGGWTSWACF